MKSTEAAGRIELTETSLPAAAVISVIPRFKFALLYTSTKCSLFIVLVLLLVIEIVVPDDLRLTKWGNGLIYLTGVMNPFNQSSSSSWCSEIVNVFC